MRTTTFKFFVQGDSYNELVEKADSAITKFLDSDSEFLDSEDDELDEEDFKSSKSSNYEMIVSKNDLNDEYEYSAEVITRIKDV